MLSLRLPRFFGSGRVIETRPVTHHVFSPREYMAFLPGNEGEVKSVKFVPGRLGSGVNGTILVERKTPLYVPVEHPHHSTPAG